MARADVWPQGLQRVGASVGLSFLERFRSAPPAPLMFEGLAQARAYWEGLRQNGQLPARLALDPRGLSGVLDRVLLVERIGRGLGQIRIAGSSLADLAGLDPRGLPLSCLCAAESRGLLAEVLEQVFVAPAVAELDLGPDRGAQGSVVARLLLLPLQSEGERRQALGILGYPTAGLAPCRFQILSRREERLVLPPIVPVDDPVPAPTVPRRPHLSLVHCAP